MFMSSGHWQNTGLARWVSKNLYNYDTNNEKSMNPMRWHLLQNDGDVKTVRDSINGFPCRLILVNDGTSPLAEGQQEPTPGNTKDMGIFNFNNDKDNVTSLGLDTDIFPKCLSYEVTANSDTSAGAFVPFTKTAYVDVIGDLSQYEMMTGNIPLSEFGIEVGDTFEVCRLWDTDDAHALIQLCDSNGQWIENYYLNMETGKITDPNAHYIKIMFGLGTNYTEDVAFKINNIIVKPRIDGESVGGTTLIIDTNLELEYLQQSFELRYPDSDDVGSDYGYLGLETETVMAIDYFTNSKGNDCTTLLKIGENDLFKYITVSYDNDISTFTFDVYNSNKVWMQTLGPFNCGDSVDPGNYSDFISTDGYLAFAIPSGATKITIKGNEYVVKEKQSEHTIKNPYLYDGFSNYGLKRVIDWVGNCTDEEFVADYEKYFNKHYLLRYYILVITLG